MFWAFIAAVWVMAVALGTMIGSLLGGAVFKKFFGGK